MRAIIDVDAPGQLIGRMAVDRDLQLTSQHYAVDVTALTPLPAELPPAGQLFRIVAAQLGWSEQLIGEDKVLEWRWTSPDGRVLMFFPGDVHDAGGWVLDTEPEGPLSAIANATLAQVLPLAGIDLYQVTQIGAPQ